MWLDANRSEGLDAYAFTLNVETKVSYKSAWSYNLEKERM